MCFGHLWADRPAQWKFAVDLAAVEFVAPVIEQATVAVYQSATAAADTGHHLSEFDGYPSIAMQ